MLDAPLCYVHGNHDPLVEYSSASGTKTAPEGGDNIDLRCVNVAACSWPDWKAASATGRMGFISTRRTR